MWIRNLDLGDFGIFQRSRLDDLEPGLNVICGPQRAGKTTFMQALRYLGYGFPRKGNIPPPVDAYDVAANIVHDDKKWRVTTKGHAAPRIVALDRDDELDPQDVYGVDAFQYRQLFTISLDELRRIPHGVDDGQKQDLTAVLLGAGWADVLKIPEMKASIKRDWKQNLGGVNGTAYEMGTVLDRINEGKDERDAATEQVEAYRSKVLEIEEIDEQLRELDDEIKQLERDALLQRTIEENLNDFRQYRDLEKAIKDAEVNPRAYPDDVHAKAARLQGDYEDVAQDYREATDAFATASSAEDLNEQRQRLIAKKDAIQRYKHDLSGWEKEVDRLLEDESDLEDDIEELSQAVRRMYQGWEDPSDVETVRTDLVGKDRVQQAVQAYKGASTNHVDNLHDQHQLQEEIEELRDLAKEAPEATTSGISPKLVGWGLAGLAAVTIIAGVGAAQLVSPVWTAMVAVVVFGLAAAFLIQQLEIAGTDAPTAESYRHQIPPHERKLGTLEDEEEDLKQALDEASEELEAVQEDLGIPTDVSADAVLEFYETAKRLRKTLKDIRSTRIDLEEERENLSKTLSEAAKEVSSVVDVAWDEQDPIESSDAIFAAVKKAHGLLGHAQNVTDTQEEKEELEEELGALLASIDASRTLPQAPRDPAKVEDELASLVEEAEHVEEVRGWIEDHERLQNDLLGTFEREQVQDVLEPSREPDGEEAWTLKAFENASQHYASEEAVQSDLSDTQDKLDEVKNRRDDLQGDRGGLRNEKKSLATDEKLRDAQQKINEARAKLEPMAERWATLRIAETILDELYDRFVEQAAGPLLREASQTFKRLTGEDYTKLTPGGDVKDLEKAAFHAHRSDGQAQTTQELSRATREQLFLSVRLARIRQIDPALPVILDDSTTNFDPQHQLRALEAVTELARTHQVFLLTCHPELIERVEASATDATYWNLVDGRFEGPFEQGDPAVEPVLP